MWTRLRRQNSRLPEQLNQDYCNRGNGHADGLPNGCIMAHCISSMPPPPSAPIAGWNDVTPNFFCALI